MKYTRQYVDVTKWHRWYAWYPVKITTWQKDEPIGILNISCIVWCEYVWRKIRYQCGGLDWEVIKTYSTSEKKPT
jgi:hypothetical protein